MSVVARIVGLSACLLVLGCSQSATGARLRVYTDEALSLRTNALCVRPLSREGGGFEPIRADHLVLLSPSGSGLDWRIEIQARREPNCDAPGEPIVRRIVARRYRRGQVVDSLPDILLIDPCEGQCDPPRTTCVPCGEFYRAGAPLPPGCSSPSDASPVCIPPEDAPWFDVAAEEDAGLPSIDANEDANTLSADATSEDAPGLDAPGLDAPGLDAFTDDAFADDAFTELDSPSGDDAFTELDAFAEPDAFVPIDAHEPPDAGLDSPASGCLPPSCDHPTFGCLAEGDLCGATGMICDGGSCTNCAGCAIEGMGCVSLGAENGSVCEYCDASNPFGWTRRPDGFDCREGATFRSCRAGFCMVGCQGCTIPGCTYPEACCPVGTSPIYSCTTCFARGSSGPSPAGPCQADPVTPGTCDGVSMTCNAT